jgi:iron(III) transport system ATP-binding protein
VRRDANLIEHIMAGPDHSDISLKAVDLQIENVSAAYGALKVLDDVNLDIQPGEFFALLGPSGCGKTTLLRLIAGFADNEAGRIVVGGKDISNLPPWKRDVGMVFQSYALWPHMSVASNVAFGLEERRVSRDNVRRRVAAALAFVGLSDLADRRPSQLSGGQQQRVALARTIAIEPKVLLLDEPLSNLDAKLRIQVRRELRLLQKRLGLTTIIVTHDQEEANTISDRVAVMNGGKIQQVGTPTELYERPANLFVAQFLGTANVLEGRVASMNGQRMFEVGNGLSLPIPATAEVPDGARMVFRPQHASLSINRPSAPGDAAIPGIVSDREFLGSIVRYAVRIGVSEVWIDTPFESGEQLLAPATPVYVSVTPELLRWLPG